MRVIGFAGWSGSGKTSLVERVITLLDRRGLRVSLVKHARDAFDIDQEGKDSWRYRHAGCREVLISSGRRWSLIHELRGDAELPLDGLLARLSDCDLVLVEGFKRAPIPKIEVCRSEAGEPLLFPDDPHIVAVASDTDVATHLPQLDINDPQAVANFIIEFLFTQATTERTP